MNTTNTAKNALEIFNKKYSSDHTFIEITNDNDTFTTIKCTTPQKTHYDKTEKIVKVFHNKESFELEILYHKTLNTTTHFQSRHFPVIKQINKKDKTITYIEPDNFNDTKNIIFDYSQICAILGKSKVDYNTFNQLPKLSDVLKEKSLQAQESFKEQGWTKRYELAKKATHKINQMRDTALTISLLHGNLTQENIIKTSIAINPNPTYGDTLYDISTLIYSLCTDEHTWNNKNHINDIIEQFIRYKTYYNRGESISSNIIRQRIYDWLKIITTLDHTNYNNHTNITEELIGKQL